MRLKTRDWFYTFLGMEIGIGILMFAVVCWAVYGGAK